MSLETAVGKKKELVLPSLEKRDDLYFAKIHFCTLGDDDSLAESRKPVVLLDYVAYLDHLYVGGKRVIGVSTGGGLSIIDPANRQWNSYPTPPPKSRCNGACSVGDSVIVSANKQGLFLVGTGLEPLLESVPENFRGRVASCGNHIYYIVGGHIVEAVLDGRAVKVTRDIPSGYDHINDFTLVGEKDGKAERIIATTDGSVHVAVGDTFHEWFFLTPRLRRHKLERFFDVDFARVFGEEFILAASMYGVMLLDPNKPNRERGRVNITTHHVSSFAADEEFGLVMAVHSESDNFDALYVSRDGSSGKPVKTEPIIAKNSPATAVLLYSSD